jgi:prevent-host-death family protein
VFCPRRNAGAAPVFIAFDLNTDQNTDLKLTQVIRMKALQVQDDIIPIGEFKTHAARIMRQLRDNGRPIVITQHGKPAGVLLPPADFDRLTERERFVAAIRQGLAESNAGLGITDEELGAELDRRYGTSGET